MSTNTKFRELRDFGKNSFERIRTYLGPEKREPLYQSPMNYLHQDAESLTDHLSRVGKYQMPVAFLTTGYGWHLLGNAVGAGAYLATNSQLAGYAGVWYGIRELLQVFGLVRKCFGRWNIPLMETKI